MDSAAELEAGEQSIDTLTAGNILQQERQRLGMIEREVADQLHITIHYVRALVSNSYEKLPGAVFAKGYLKSYALFLGLDVEDLMSRYDELTRQQNAGSAEERRLLRARKKKDRNKPLVIVSLIIFFVGFLGLWLANSYFVDESFSDLPSTAESVDGAENTRPALSQVVEPQLTIQAQLTLEVELEEISEIGRAHV
jgi:cytoskeleton protein RodZ